MTSSFMIRILWLSTAFIFILQGCQSCEPGPDDERDAVVPDVMSSCEDTPVCQLNTYGCEDGEQVVQCIKDDAGCAQWSPLEVCKEGLQCYQGGCFTAEQIECPGSCTKGEVYCDKEGKRARCEDLDRDGCGELNLKESEACEDGLWCYSGECLRSVDVPEIPDIAKSGPDFVSIFERGRVSYPIDEQIVVLPYESFMRAIEGRYYDDIPSNQTDKERLRDRDENGVDDSIDLAIKTTMDGNNINMLGLYAQIDELGERGSFKGDIFIVVMDPVSIPPKEVRPGALVAGQIESKRYFVAVAHGLSGQTPWQFTNASMVGLDATASFSNQCCGVKGGENACGGADPSGSPFGGGRMPCGGGMLDLFDCPVFDSDIMDKLSEPPLNVFDRDPEAQPFRVGFGQTTLPDNQELTTGVITRGNGFPAVVFYPFQERSFHEDGTREFNDGTRSYYDDIGKLDGRFLDVVAQAPGGIMCEFCSQALCGEVGGGLTQPGFGEYMAGTKVGECGEMRNWVDPICQRTGGGVDLASSCGGFCGSCFGLDERYSEGQGGFCGGFAGSTSASTQFAAGGSPRCGAPTVPDFCTQVEGDGPCDCDSDCQDTKIALWATAMGCGFGGGGSSLPGVTCCGDGSSPCACQRSGSVTICQGCDGGGNCSSFGAYHGLDELVDGTERFDTFDACNAKYKDCLISVGGDNLYHGSNLRQPESGVKEKPTETKKSNDNKQEDMPETKLPKQPKKEPVDPEQVAALSDEVKQGFQELLESDAGEPPPNIKDLADKSEDIPEGQGKFANTVDESIDKAEDKLSDSVGHLDAALDGVTRAANELMGDSGPDKPESGMDPVELFSGDFALSQKDMSYAGPVRPLEFVRHYISQGETRSILGSNWSHNFNVRVVPIQQETAPEWVPDYCKTYDPLMTCAIVYDANHATRLYLLDPASDRLHGVRMFMPQAGNANTLYYEDDMWVLRRPNGHIQIFNEYGYMIEDRDRFGNGFDVTYEPTPSFQLYSRWCRADPRADRQYKNEYQAQAQFDERICLLLGWIVGDRSEPQVPKEGYQALAREALSLAGSLTVQLPVEKITGSLEHSDLEKSTGLVYHADMSGTIARDIQYAKAMLASGTLPMSPTGSVRMRPVLVRDDLGRELNFDYVDDPTQPDRYGLLKSVTGPMQTTVTYTYDDPYGSDAKLQRLNEAFLTTITRQDNPMAHPSVVPAPTTTVELQYNWPGVSQSYDESGDQGPYRQRVYETYLDFFTTSYGCLYNNDENKPTSICNNASSSPSLTKVCVGSNSVYLGADAVPSSGSTCVATPLDGKSSKQHLPGNPLQLAMMREHHYVSDVADNIIKVTINGSVEVESRYGLDPYSEDFERVVAQRYGGYEESGYPDGAYRNKPLALQNAQQGGSWTSTLPGYKISYLASHPSDYVLQPQDVTEVVEFLPSTLKARFPLESLPTDLKFEDSCATDDFESCSEIEPSDIWPFNGNADTLQFEPYTCRINSRGKLKRRLPGWRPELTYFPLDDVQASPSTPKPIYRSRISCHELASRQIGDATHNGVMHGRVIRDTRGAWEIISGRRDEIEDDLRRTCAWVKLIDRDGDETYYGLNFRGLTNVQAQRDDTGNAWIITEYIYNADGMIIQVRDPTLGALPWQDNQGAMEYEYAQPDPEAGFKKWEPFWWTRRFNRLVERVVPTRDNDHLAYAHRKESQGLVAQEIASLETRYAYEPLFNQVHRIESWLMRPGDTAPDDGEIQTTTFYEFDYQEYDIGSQAFCDALSGFQRWGLELFFPIQTDAEGNIVINRQCDALHLDSLFAFPFHNKNINADLGFEQVTRDAVISGTEGIGFPNFTLSPVQHIKGVPVRITTVNHEQDSVYTTLIGYAPSGRPAYIVGSDRSLAVFKYYSYNADGTSTPEQLYGGDLTGNLASGSYFKGLLAEVSIKRFDETYGVEDGPAHLPGCDALAGPYRWIIPGGCADRADAVQKLQDLGLPSEVYDTLLAIIDPEESSHWTTTRLAYTPYGKVDRTWLDGRETSHMYDSVGRVMSMTDPLGNVTTFERNSRGWTSSQSIYSAANEFMGRTHFQYDGEGHVLTSCVDIVDGACQSSPLSGQSMEPVSSGFSAVSFDAPRQYTSDDPEFLLSTARYTPEGNVYKTMGPDGVEVTTYYNARALRVRQIVEAPTVQGQTPPAREERWVYDHRANRTDKAYSTSDPLDATYVESFDFDGLGRTVSVNDIRGVLFHTAYDARSRMVANKQDVAPYGASWVADPERWESFKAYHNVDAEGRPLIVSSRQDVQEVATINSRGQIMKMQRTGESPSWSTYDNKGNPVMVVDGDGNRTVSISDEDLYQDPSQADDMGLARHFQVTFMQDSRNQLRPAAEAIIHTQTMKYVSDVLGRPVLETVYGYGEAQQLLEATTIFETNAQGFLTASVNAEGVRATSTYNVLGWPLTSSVPAPGGGDDVTQWRYDYRGMPAYITDPKGEQTRHVYDGFGQLRETFLPRDVTSAHQQFVYDGHGRIKESLKRPGKPEEERQEYVYNGVGDLVQTNWIAQNIQGAQEVRPLHKSAYDELGRVTSQIDFNAQLAQQGFVGAVTQNEYVYDALGRVTTETLSLRDVEGGTPSHSYSTHTNYVLSGSGGAQTWDVGVTYPGGSVWTTKFDGLGRQKRVHDGAQTQIEHLWLGGRYRGRAHEYETGIDPVEKVRTFDGFGRTTGLDYRAVDINASGQPANGVWGNTYCGGTWQANCAAPLYNVEMKFDVMNRITALQRQFAHPISAGPQVIAPEAHRRTWRGYDYNEQGHLIKEWHQAGVSAQAWDGLSNHTLTTSDVVQVGGSGDAWLWQREAHVGSLSAITLESDPTQSRWKHVKGDQSGVPTGRQAGYQLEALELDGQTRVTGHDGHGRLIQGIDFEHVYDVQDRLVGIKYPGEPDLTEAYFYDGSGRLTRVWSSSGSEEIMVHYGHQMIEAYDQYNTLLWEAVWGPGIDELMAWKQGSTTYIPLTDERQSVVGLWNTSDKILEELTEYDALGRVRALNQDEQVVCEEGAGQKVCTKLGGAFPFAFNSAWRSPTSGLLSMRNRWYSAELGQFLTHDPLGTVDSFNMYAFAAFDPINGWDPMGLATEDPNSAGDNYSTRDHFILALDDLARAFGDLNGDVTTATADSIQGNEDLGINTKAAGIAALEIWKVMTPQNGDEALEEVAITVATLGVGKLVQSGKNGVKAILKKLRKQGKATKKGLTKGDDIVEGLGKKSDPKQGKSCSGGKCPGGGCFVPGTHILMADGSTKPIEDVQIDDEVWVDDPLDDLPPAKRRVLQTLRSMTYRVLDIELVTLQGDDAGMLSPTGEHPFWTLERGWIKAEGLRVGDLLSTEQGEYLQVRAVTQRSERSPTYDLVVEGHEESYFVNAGDHYILVDAADKAASDGERYVALTPDTLVHAQRGLVRADELEPGEKVLSRNHLTGEQDYQPLNHIGVALQAQTLAVTIKTAVGGVETLELAYHKKLWVMQRGWVQAQLLQVGDVLRVLDDEVAQVTHLEMVKTQRLSIAFEVDAWHSFFVGSVGALVHNQDLGKIVDYVAVEAAKVSQKGSNNTVGAAALRNGDRIVVIVGSSAEYGQGAGGARNVMGNADFLKNLPDNVQVVFANNLSGAHAEEEILETLSRRNEAVGSNLKLENMRTVTAGPTPKPKKACYTFGCRDAMKSHNPDIDIRSGWDGGGGVAGKPSKPLEKLCP